MAIITFLVYFVVFSSEAADIVTWSVTEGKHIGGVRGTVDTADVGTTNSSRRKVEC